MVDPVLNVTSAAQFKALAHPLRQRLLFALGESATMSQLARSLGEHKGNIAHHLKVLRDAGMVQVVHTQKVRGGTEQHYQRTAERIDVGGVHAAPIEAMLGAVAHEIASSVGDPLLTLRHVRLDADQARLLAERLADLVAEAEDDGPGVPRYGLLVSLYAPSEPA